MVNAVELFKQGVAQYRAGRPNEAARVFRDLIQLAPHHALAYQNLSAILRAGHRFDEAIEILQKGHQACPDAKALEYSLAHNLLQAGHFRDGWRHFDVRIGHVVPPPSADFPMWRGEALAGRSILVLPEQGYGDQIQFVRFVPRLIDAGAKVTLVCPSVLAPLFANLGATVISANEQVALSRHDYWTFPMSLAGELGAEPSDWWTGPYLYADPIGSGGIGVATHGRPTHKDDAARSLDAASAEALRAIGRSLAPQDTGAADFLETARIIAGLDLVISVDTSVAHLAGALGKPVWILLPAVKTDWRWLRERSDSPWYPSARLFRQPKLGDWPSVMAEIQTALDAER